MVILRCESFVRAQDRAGEGVELGPSAEQLSCARDTHAEKQLCEPQHTAVVAADVTVRERKAAQAARERRGDSRGEPVVLVPRVQLVAQPEERRDAR